MSDRLRRYEERTSTPLLVLALIFVVLYAVPIIRPDLGQPTRGAVAFASALIWLLFAADLAVRVALADRRWRYLVGHPIDVVAVALPALRPLRVLRVFTAGRALFSRTGRFSLARTTQAVGISAAVLVGLAGLAVLDAERGADGGNIRNLGDALWWAATTVTTVGYGDRFPVTGGGRLIAVGLMLVGISLVGVVTASVAAWFVSLSRPSVQAEEARIEDRLARMEAQLTAIQRAVGDSPA